MVPSKTFSWLVLILIPLIIKAQELPPVQIFSPKVYGAENQNWSISQSKEKFIYVANNKGLLEFDGAIWQLYTSPNDAIMRSVKVIDELIYTGSYMEFGYWHRNEKGGLNYTSLREVLKIKFLDDEEIWNIISLDDYILFQSLKRIYIYNRTEKTYTVIDSDSTIHKMFKVNNAIYFQKDKEGIFKIEKGRGVLVSEDHIFTSNIIVNIFSAESNLLIETENNGFFVLKDGVLQKWEIPANEMLLNVSVYRSIQLIDKSFVLGTISNGIIYLTKNGEVKYNIDNIHGLSNNTVHAVFEDQDSNIWVGLENGINCININSPFNIYNDENGKIGTVNALSLFNNKLYIGTNQGLFFKPLNSTEEFKFIENTQGAVWCLVQLDDKLFCGHNSGTFIVNNDLVEKISDIQGTWNIIPINNNKGRLLQGNYDGLYVLEKKNEKWHFKNKIEGFAVSSRFFQSVGEDQILISHEHQGVIKVKVDKDFTKAIKISNDVTVKKGLNSSLIKYNKEILYSYKEGVFKYDTIFNRFNKDTLLSNIFRKEVYSSGKLVPDAKNNVIWAFSNKQIYYINYSGLSKAPKVNRIPFSSLLPKGLTGYENISHIKDNKYLLGASGGYIVIDLDKLQDKSYTIDINSVTKSNIKGGSIALNKSTEGFFENKNNNVEFKYSVVKFDKYLDTEYQYQLEGIYNQWSHWTPDSHVFLKNLPYGTYTFNVRAKVGNVITSNIAKYKFQVERPWYLSNNLIAIYILVFLLLSFLMHNTYKRYYKRQRERLLQKTSRDLELKELENRQQLMRFNNENLRQDIENKNRELGISTMSLIKKNEFLNSIKKELKNISSSDNSLKSVIRIIDQNLNNNDDWHVFEEAFNNADKDFLKKIKTLHPALTSNDLRLCAYLRLNLSSKEIAPLLNISSRSVEVKRYRLRKKMDLPRESSLTNYILEI